MPGRGESTSGSSLAAGRPGAAPRVGGDREALPTTHAPVAAPARTRRRWLEPLFRPGALQSAVLGGFMLAAGALDYGVSVVAGRSLGPVDFGVFISVTALVQILLSLSMGIRIVVAYYTAESAAAPGAEARVRAFLRAAWRWSLGWGLLATLAIAAVGPALARSLRMPDATAIWAASLMAAALFMRQTTFGALQGLQSFTALGVVQVVRGGARLLLTAGLIGLGMGATGAILAQPLACLLIVAIGVWLLRDRLFHQEARPVAVSWHYSVSTVVGLLVFGLLTNIDAVFVKRFYDPAVAGNYGPVVTLERIGIFLPSAIGFVLLPKVAGRTAAGRDPRPILFLSLAAAILPGLLLVPVYLVAPGAVVRAVFGRVYADPGVVLGLIGLAAALAAGVNIWLDYALSLQRKAYVYWLAAVVVLQAAGMYAFGRDGLVRMATVVVAGGLAANVAGYLTTCLPAPRKP